MIDAVKLSNSIPQQKHAHPNVLVTTEHLLLMVVRPVQIQINVKDVMKVSNYPNPTNHVLKKLYVLALMVLKVLVVLELDNKNVPAVTAILFVIVITLHVLTTKIVPVQMEHLSNKDVPVKCQRLNVNLVKVDLLI